jgi:hypothetical protein
MPQVASALLYLLGAEDRNIFQSSRKIVLVRAVTAT